MMFARLALAGLALALPALADYSYKQTSQMTGGALLRMMKMLPGGGKATQPIVTTMYLKGNRMATAGEDSISVIDLDKETMTEINLKDKTYAVITFEEMKQAMEEMARRMSQQQQAQTAPSDAQIEFKIDVKETGNTKEISGLNTREFMMLMGWKITDAKTGQSADMNMDTQMWMAKDIPGYDEVRKFYLRMSQKIAWAPGMASNAMAAMQPNVRQGMNKLVQEAQKLEGTPVVQVTKMKMVGANGEIPDIPEMQMPGMREAMQREAANTATREAGYQAARATGGRMGGLAGTAAAGALGGMMGGFGKKKKKEEEPKTADKQPEAAKGDGTYMEITNTTSDWSTADVDGSRFTPPAGFKEVEHSMKKALRK